MAEVAAAGGDWIKELVQWFAERNLGRKGSYQDGDTSVHINDIQVLTRLDFRNIYRRAGLKQRLKNGVLSFVLMSPDGGEEAAYLATRKLPLTLPAAREL